MSSLGVESAEVDRLLAALRDIAERPLEQARAMPPGVYTSEAFHALERARIFAREWLCAGRAESVANPGDYLTWSAGEQPLFVVRGEDGALRAFANVCLHRMMCLLEGRGHRRRIVCPYHAWTYGLDGRLQRARHMERTAGFNAGDLRLPEIRCEVWEGWIFVTLDPDAVPVAERLAALHAVVEPYGMGEYVEVLQEDHEWDTNWKCLTENFMEGYHLPITHRETVGAYFPPEETEFPEATHDGFTYQTFIKTPDAPIGTAHPDNTRLTGRWRSTSVLPTIFPSFMMTLAPDHLWYLSLQPNGVAKARMRYGIALAPEVHAAAGARDAVVARASEFLARVNAEDRAVVEGIFRGARAPLSRPGPLSWLEREIHDFVRYLARRLSA